MTKLVLPNSGNVVENIVNKSNSNFDELYAHGDNIYLCSTVAELYNLVSTSQSGYWLLTNNITMTASKTIPSGVTLVFQGGKLILGNYDITLLDTKIKAGLDHIFDYTGTGIVNGTYKTDKIYIDWFGATYSDSVNETDIINNAIEFSALNQQYVDVVIASDYIRSDSTIILTKYTHLTSNSQSVIDNTNLPASTASIKIGYGGDDFYGLPGGDPRSYSQIIVISKICFDGNYGHMDTGSGGYLPDGSSYTTNSKCLEFGGDNEYSFYFVIQGCSFIHFDYVTEYNNNCAIHGFRDCYFRFNNHACYFDGSGHNNRGERIYYDNCVIGNNNNGIYNKEMMITFINCSIDYNDKHVEENETEVGGQTEAKLSFQNCHIEDSVSAVGTGVKIINNGYMVFDNTILWSNQPNYITNNDDMYMNNVFFRITASEENYIVSGNPIYLSNPKYFVPTRPFMLTPKNSNILNSDIETGDITGYTAMDGSNVTASTTKKNGGTYSLKVAGVTSISGRAKTAAIPIGGYRKIIFNCFTNLYETSSTSTCWIRYYDAENNEISTKSFAMIRSGSDVFEKIQISDTIPSNAMYCKIDIKLAGMGTADLAYIDDLYLRLY